MKRIRNSIAARLLSWVLTAVMITPLLCGLIAPQAMAQQGGSAATGNLLTVIVIDFANKSQVGGEALARFATDAVAVEMASSARFEVLKRDEVIRTANDLNFRAPYDKSQLTKIAQTLGAAAIVTGEVSFVKPEGKKAGDKTVSVGVQVRITEASSGELINGSAQIGRALSKPGVSDNESLAQEAVGKAAVLGIREIVSYTLPEGVILITVGSGDSLQVTINRGSRDGLKEGQELMVLRERQRVGRIKVTRVFPVDCECSVIDLGLGMRPSDTVRAVFPMPEFDIHGKTVTRNSHNNSNSMSSVGKVFLLVGLIVGLSTALHPGGSVTNVTAEADIVTGTPVVRLNWRDNLFSGNTQEYHIWRLPENSFNTSGTPNAAIQLVRTYTEYPTPTSFWDGVKGFLQTSQTGQGGQGGQGGQNGQGLGTIKVPTVGFNRGFIFGNPLFYQFTAIVRRTAVSQGGSQGNQGGQGNQSQLEDVEMPPIQSGQVTALNQPTLDPLIGNGSLQTFKSILFKWNSTVGADVYQVELSTEPTFKVRNLVLQLPVQFSTSVNAVASQSLPAPLNLEANPVLLRNPAYAAFMNGAPGAAPPSVYWRVGGRNNADAPGPVHWISKNNKDADRSFRFIYSDVKSILPNSQPPQGPGKSVKK